MRSRTACASLRLPTIHLSLVWWITALVIVLPLCAPSASPALSCTAMGFGALPTVGAIGVAAEADCYTFTGAVGDAIRVRVIKTSGTLEPLADIMRPNGTTLCGTTLNDEFTCTLNAAGLHTLLIRDFYGTRTGGYNLDLD